MKCKAGIENYSRIIFTVLDFYRITDWFVDTFVSLFFFHLFFSFLVIPSIRNIYECQLCNIRERTLLSKEYEISYFSIKHSIKI